MAFLALGAVGVFGGWAGGQVGALLRRRQAQPQGRSSRTRTSEPEGEKVVSSGPAAGLQAAKPPPPADLVLSLASPGAQRQRSDAPSFAGLSQSLSVPVPVSNSWASEGMEHPTWAEAYTHFTRLAAMERLERLESALGRCSQGSQQAGPVFHLSVHNSNDSTPPLQPAPPVLPPAVPEVQTRDLAWLKATVTRELLKVLAVVCGWEAAKAHVAARRRAAATTRLEGAPPLARLLAQARGGAPWAGRGKSLFLLQ